MLLKRQIDLFPPFSDFLVRKSVYQKLVSLKFTSFMTKIQTDSSFSHDWSVETVIASESWKVDFVSHSLCDSLEPGRILIGEQEAVFEIFKLRYTHTGGQGADMLIHPQGSSESSLLEGKLENIKGVSVIFWSKLN